MLQISLKGSQGETQTLIKRIASYTGIKPLAASVLVKRGIVDVGKAKEFLQADTFHDPFLLQGMEQAIETINEAINREAPITVYGDYDCDGTSACAILYTAFAQAGIPVNVYIPDRKTEGYGLNETAVKTIAQTGGLLITVDCGITNVNEVNLANNLGLKVIVTDHHKSLDTLPDCTCINPSISAHYPCSFLCGSGVALKLVHALWGEARMKSLLDLAAIATIADLVPLLDENRTIVKAGLDQMIKNKRPGLIALIKACGYDNKKLKSGQIAFGIGPRINAAGRMGDAKRAFTLFTTQDSDIAETIANELNTENQQRQKQEQLILKSACQLLDQDMFKKRTAVVAQKGWHSGVIGIVASRLAEIYGRPSAVISINEDGLCTGSVRGIKGVHIFEALNSCHEFFLRYGGHEQAGGFTLALENLQRFVDAFEAHFTTQYPPDLWAKRIECDLSAHPADLTLSLAKDLDKLAPFGIGNPAPTLLLEKTKLIGKSNLGKTNDHLRISLEKSGSRAEGLLFRANQYDVPRVMSTCDVVGTLETDHYRGVERARYLIRAMRLSRSGFNEILRNARGTFGYSFAKCCQTLHAYISIKNADKHIQENPYGLQLHVHTPQTFDYVLTHWQDDQSMALLEPYLVSMNNTMHGKNALVIAPDVQENTAYPKVFRLDSDDSLSKYARYVFLQRDALANVYRQLIKYARRPLELDERCLLIANVAEVSADSVGAAVAVFEELGFLTAEPMVLRIHTIDGKKELTSSVIYTALMEMAGRDDNYAEERCIHA